MDNEFSRPRVNASLLSSYSGRQVCALGMAKNVDSSGLGLTLATGDGKEIKITMQEPLTEYVAGLTEIHGKVDERGSGIVCDHYVLFPEQASNTFDMQMYNQAVELMTRLPDHYQIGVKQ
ncbi:replication protein A 14 kDa subunit-like [Haliotis rufescens]|uniref:replication protein A 14 kDa subunit-like n=1 Tax=Haliotis rufescens TaxID=6454 RepID=UPI001EB03ED7|nr:replication protein A 14 kDa subunit-like [Haliotis rufescens]